MSTIPKDWSLRSTNPTGHISYQQEAIDKVCEGFAAHDRGQLILPCGTGKTVVTLWIAERLVGKGGRVLYLVPSIALMAQTMREWSDAETDCPLRYVGICSDTRAGRNDEDASLLELDYPVTTDPDEDPGRFDPRTPRGHDGSVLHLPIATAGCGDAQVDGAPAFDLVVCDEAHRTTGVEDAAIQARKPNSRFHRSVWYTTVCASVPGNGCTRPPRPGSTRRRLKVAQSPTGNVGNLFDGRRDQLWSRRSTGWQFSEAIEGGLVDRLQESSS